MLYILITLIYSSKLLRSYHSAHFNPNLVRFEQSFIEKHDVDRYSINN